MPFRTLSHGSKNLADFTSPQLLFTGLEKQSAADCVKELCRALEQEGRVVDGSAFYEAVLAREEISPTSFVAGWALPHARLCEVPRLTFALARTVRPVQWFGHTETNIHTVFLFAVPEAEAKIYLSVVAAVAQLSQNRLLLEHLTAAKDPATMMQALERSPIRGLTAPPLLRQLLSPSGRTNIERDFHEP